VDNLKINVVERGSGAVPIILIHGFTCSLSDWSSQLSSLSTRYRCIAFDLPGHGKSPDPQQATIETLARCINDALDNLRLDKVVLAGHSMGCRVISEMTRQSPSRVRGLVYIDGSIVADRDADAAVSRAIATVERFGMQQFLDKFYRGFFAENTPSAIRKSVWTHFASIDMNFARALWLDMIRWDASQSRLVLGTIDVPALVIQSTFLDSDLQRISLSPGQSSTWVDEVSEVVDDVTVQIIEGIGHFPMLEAPEKTNEEILRFMQRIR